MGDQRRLLLKLTLAHRAAFVKVGSNRTCGAAASRMTCRSALHGAPGPELPSTHHADAAPQLHQTGHSSMAQHFRGKKAGRAGLCCRLKKRPQCPVWRTVQQTVLFGALCADAENCGVEPLPAIIGQSKYGGGCSGVSTERSSEMALAGKAARQSGFDDWYMVAEHRFRAIDPFEGDPGMRRDPL